MAPAPVQAKKTSRKFPIFIVDAFTTGDNDNFSGNPVSICLLNYDDEVPDDTKLKIGKQMNHSNTAFVSGGWSRDQDLSSNETNHWAVRWVTPQTEVPLCGIGTLGAAHIMFHKVLRHREIYDTETCISFETKANGKLSARMVWATGQVTVSFPANVPAPFNRENNRWMNELIDATLGPAVSGNSVDDVQFAPNIKVVVIRIKAPQGVDPGCYLRKVHPDTMAMLKVVPKDLSLMGVCVTIQGTPESGTPHFFSRMFSPWIGLTEDPVCGSMHTALAPYWSKVLGQTGETLLGRMVSPERTGDLFVTVLGDRVHIGGKNRTVVEGEIRI